MACSGHMDKAAAAYERALELDPDSKGAACNLCNIRQFRHELEEAEACYRGVGQ